MKTINSCELVISAPDKESWPDTALPEVVLAGRSNVGKSSFINTLTNRKKLAYVGNTPGKTRLLNFFNINDELMFVDVPGYGYANISKHQLIQFGEMMEDYFGERQQKVGLVLIVDSRHNPTEDDITMMEYARYHKMKVVVIATKVDKLKKNERIKNYRRICKGLEIPEEALIPFSSETRMGVDKAWQAIEEMYQEKAV
ncbi:GTP-binding protein [Breznakia sp. PF5-3]|uniref:ribosome biogenesis GTP-binding protein YihA/YsxC n=1 Tax=unclassified Breznakia TaxID=2623764 RepID=UPI002404AD21|nr:MULTISPECIES: ribosome biogenesis GTP-binding protein YihA/YsxC [unclassified Breznakia]MDF9824112.1 GTP-binding protein [Breznakia sp. PM6-1]MDF9834910.1 GTP-binding protein [Breznakia sp. PF5-3]MDF9837221.1 GTP-binding protein [Breznakia sp. PFB2-8]MDF9859211.1 GTP-binding protein [Breznakia sp. PH5-24]